MTKQIHWTKPLRAAGFLATGKVGQVIFMFVALSLAARSLGVEQFGKLVLIHTLILAVVKATQFQTWQALVHYGAKAQEENDKERLQRIIKFSFLLDFATALLAYGAIWLICLFLLSYIGIDAELAGTVKSYGTVIILMVLNGTPNGILQLFDKFDKIALYTATAPLVRLIGCVYLFLSEGTFLQFLLVWYLSEVIAALLLLSFALWSLYSHKLLTTMFRKTQASLLKPERGIWRYVFGTQIVSTLDLATTHTPVLFVGGLLGPGAAGLYKVAQEFASVLLKPGAKLFGQAIYPDLARLSAKNDNHLRRQMVVRNAALIGSIGLAVFVIFVLFGHQLITLSVGPDFTDAYPTMIWLCFAGVIVVSGFALEPLLISAGCIRETVFARTFAILLFIPALYSLLVHQGIIGAGVAVCIYAVLSTFFLIVASRKLFDSSRLS